MKLRSKLYLSFCIMIVLPVALCCCAVYMIFCLQKESISETYNVDGKIVLENLYSPITIYGRMTDNIYEELIEKAEESPKSFNNGQYIREVDQSLRDCLSCLVIRKNGIITYSSVDDISAGELLAMLPEYDENSNTSDVGVYKGGEHQKLIKQIDFQDDDNNTYSVFIVTSLKQVIPQIKVFVFQVIMAILAILILTGVLLSIWVYRSMLRPLNRLKLATDNIKNGNMDFEMPKNTNDEFGEVFNDFEEMRVILKKTSEDKLKSDAEEKELIRNISHDLKTPLTAIKGYVEGILDGVADTPEKQEKYLRTIANKANDMSKLIDELTIYSRLDANRVPYSFTKLNVKGYFDDCCDEIQTELEASGIELDYKYHAGNDVLIVADPEQLKRVINNIISNSVKYMADRKGHISIDVFDEGEYVHIIMADNGKGIECKDLPHIFERFYRTDSSRNSKQGGSGIGLAIVKKIIEDHKGKIWAESVEGEGTTMHLNLHKYEEESSYPCIEDKHIDLGTLKR